jgi:hypothetical protein
MVARYDVLRGGAPIRGRRFRCGHSLPVAYPFFPARAKRRLGLSAAR